ncbi:unnamed protein product [Owenia fusiformis]|nr:unnamed protein product [Owenia fusiformis]
MGDEKPVLPGVTVKAAPTHQLAQLSLDCFGDEGELADSSDFPRVLFLMHKWFMTSEDLAQQYINLFNSGTKFVTCPTNCDHDVRNDQCPLNIFKLRICHALSYWIMTFPVHFDLDGNLSNILTNFKNTLTSQGYKLLAELVDTSRVPSYDWIRAVSVRNPMNLRRSQKVTLEFNHLQPNDLAEQLTFLEYKALRRITFTDFKNYAVRVSLKDNPKLERSISLFNGLSQWIQCMVLSKTTPQQRADIIVKFINVAKRLRELQNFNTMMAVVGGLTHSALARLAKTMACLPSDAQKILLEYSEVLSSNNNFSNYRRVYGQCKGFRIPILGVHLKDLILLHTALPDWIEPNMLNFRKMVQMSVIFTELMHLQNTSVPIEANMDLVNTLRLSLDMHYTEDDIYELSLAREPRNSLSSPSTPTKPVVFADWIAGVSPPDTEIINKHVHDMVEAVFKNYDHDRDGFISHAEFEAIAGNFPFIDSFCVLDADQDGMISKAEMKTYFIRANCHAVKSSFKHDFHEFTYFKPTFCIHCTGLLWGLIKQGWKCKECGINAHKHCKDLVVMECRHKAHSGVLSRNSISTGQHNITASSKRKMSQRQKRSRSHKGVQTDETLVGSPNLAGSQSECKETEEVLSSNNLNNADTEFFEDQHVVYDRMLKAEEERDKMIADKNQLQSKLNEANDQISTLKGHIGTIRQHTVTFILDQMDTLHMQRDTEV